MQANEDRNPSSWDLWGFIAVPLKSNPVGSESPLSLPPFSTGLQSCLGLNPAQCRLLSLPSTQNPS